MEGLKIKISGIAPLLMNNPQSVDPFNKYKIDASKITSKRTKTEEDHYRLREIEVRSKIYWDDEIGIYIPSTWIIAAIGQNSNALCKIGKTKIRGAVFVESSKIPLSYENDKLVKTPQDIVKNDFFHHLMILKQGQVRVAKLAPIFHKWSFETLIETDPAILNSEDVERILHHSAKYGGFGDFRPTFGCARMEVEHV